MMRDTDQSSSKEIDTFDATIPFPSGNQEEVFTGNRGIGTITLSYDIICIEPDACSTTAASLESIGVCMCVCMCVGVYTPLYEKV